MKALVYTGPESLAFRDADEPVLESGDALVEVKAVGICGSDMHAYLGHDERRPAPLILGHEAAGMVVGGTGKGRRVTVNPLVTCMQCPACLSGRTNICSGRQIISMPPREGAFAQLIAIPERNLLDVPNDFPLQKAALCEPLACAWHAVRQASRLTGGGIPSSKCLVIGGGAIGLGSALALAAFGAGAIHIAETSALRRPGLEAAGRFTVFDPAETAPPPSSFDIVVDAYGGDATRGLASQAVRPGGLIAHIGLASGAGGLDIRRMTLQEITFIGTYTYTMTDFRETFEAMTAGRLGALDWFETRPLEQGGAAFADMRQSRVASPKIVLEP